MGNSEYKVIFHIEKILKPSFLDKKKTIKEYNLVDRQVITFASQLFCQKIPLVIGFYLLL